jgi:hypothetical protein
MSRADPAFGVAAAQPPTRLQSTNLLTERRYRHSQLLGHMPHRNSTGVELNHTLPLTFLACSDIADGRASVDRIILQR